MMGAGADITFLHAATCDRADEMTRGTLIRIADPARKLAHANQGGQQQVTV